MGYFLLKKTQTGFTFNLIASNGECIATSEVYSSHASCKSGIESVIANAQVAGVEDQTAEDFAAVKHPKFELYTDKSEKFRFRLKARNGEIIAVSQAYTTHDSASHGIESVRNNVVNAEIREEE